MSVLVLGGTAWLGREVVSAALRRDEQVTVLARGKSGSFPHGARVVHADRGDSTAYEEVREAHWDLVLDVTRQPSHARGALDALGPRAGAWVFVSSASVYAVEDSPGDDESAPLLPAHEGDDDGWETYGGRKVACERVVLDAVGDRALIARSGLIAGPGDHTDRTGYWPLRFAHPASPDGAVLVPDSSIGTQVIDVRDLAGWLVDAGLRRPSGSSTRPVRSCRSASTSPRPGPWAATTGSWSPSTRLGSRRTASSPGRALGACPCGYRCPRTQVSWRAMSPRPGRSGWPHGRWRRPCATRSSGSWPPGPRA